MNLYTKKEAYVKGAYLEKPEKFDILLHIEEKTSIKNAKNGLLMTFKELVNGLSGRYTESVILKTLIELKLDNLIAIVPAVFYNETRRVLVGQRFIICRPEKKSYDIPEVYGELIERSVQEISAYAKDGYAFNRDAFWKDLESSMNEDDSCEAIYPEVYFSIDYLFEDGDAEMKLEKKIFNRFKFDLMKSLVLKRKAVELDNENIFLLSKGNLEEIARTLTAFFQNRILPQVEAVPVVAREIDIIKLQEEIHKMEFENRQLMKFISEKTYCIRKYYEDEKFKNQKNYPGRIVFTLIRELEKFFNECGEKKYIEHIYTMYEELKNKICNRFDDLSRPIYFFTEAELEQYPPESLEKVRQERSIISTTWETHEGTIHIFMEMTFQNFNMSLEILRNLSRNEFWKILAFRKLLQDSQKIRADVNPFNNSLFHKNYAVLLNNAYQSIVPFYYNFFLWIPLDFIQNMVYRVIKKFVVERQKLMANENQTKRNIKKQIKINQVNLKKKYLKRLFIRNRILEELDFFYFKQNLIPSISDVKDRFPDLKEQQFVNIVEEFNFTIIATDSLSQFGQKILYYPRSVTWGYNLEKIKNNIDLWISQSAESSKLNEDNQTLAKRFHALNMKLQLI